MKKGNDTLKCNLSWFTHYTLYPLSSKLLANFQRKEHHHGEPFSLSLFQSFKEGIRSLYDTILWWVGVAHTTSIPDSIYLHYFRVVPILGTIIRSGSRVGIFITPWVNYKHPYSPNFYFQLGLRFKVQAFYPNFWAISSYHSRVLPMLSCWSYFSIGLSFYA